MLLVYVFFRGKHLVLDDQLVCSCPENYTPPHQLPVALCIGLWLHDLSPIHSGMSARVALAGLMLRWSYWGDRRVTLDIPRRQTHSKLTGCLASPQCPLGLSLP